MTSPPQPTPAEGKPIGQFLTPLRDLAAYVLVGAPAVFLLAAVINLLGDNFGARTAASFGGFISLETVGMPLAAVLLALGLKPVHPKARLITLAALVEYGVMAFFGVIFGLLFGVINIASYDAAGAFTALLARVAWLGVFGLAAYVVFQIWRGVYMVPKPKMPPGVYGQPQAPYGQQPYGQQPPYGQQYGQPPFPQQPQQPQPGTYGQPPAYQPGTYGQPPSSPPAQPGWNNPPVAAPPVGSTPTPASAPPASAPPAGFPAPSTPFGAPAPAAPFADPTQVVPRAEPAPIDRTSKLPDDRPGFGPADSDPPRQ
ncbi:hypothetical protein [Actinoplanes sp. L3-i22]|uniref:hypothetical protein n=1 Tax=Actinoplanes sp. L3-i22 TaxID=2836373 RepID=UPI001C790D85|nr:hypothetical protein [Actinoplanes sp. L3-i22]BCY05820.1 hypothetical protein L3i22_009080 [Actinoplanes sp. L3-i22]